MAVGGLSERLAFILELDPSNAIAGMRRVGAAADKDLGNVDDRLNRIGGRMQIAGAGAMAFAGVAGRALFSFAQASEEANLSQVKLQNSIQNSPELAGASADAFNDLADAIQSKTAADGDQIVSAMAMLGTFHQTQEQIEDITPLVVDYARKFGVDLVTAATQVGKALSGNIGTLQRNGILIEENAYATDRFAAVTDALRENVGGFAEQEGATFSGQMERLKNQLGDVAEGIGTGVIGAVNNMLGPVTAAAEAFTRLDAGTQNTIGTFAAYGTAAIGVAGASSFAIGSIIKMVDNFKAAKDGIQGFVGNGGLGRIATVAAPAVGALALFAAALQTQSQRAAEAEARITELGSAIRTTGSITEATTAQFERGELFEGLQMGAPEMVDLLARIGVELGDLQTVWEGNSNGVSVFRDKLREAYAQGELTLEQRDSLNTSIGDLSTRIYAARDASAAEAQVLGEVATAAEGAEGATDDLTGATDENTAATDENKRAQEERTEAMLGAAEGALDLQEAMLQSRDALDEYTATMGDAEASDRDKAQAGIDLQRAFYDEAEAAGDSAAAQATASGNAAGAQAASVQAQIDALSRLAANLEPGSAVRNAIESHIAALRAIPRDVETRINIRNTSSGGSNPGLIVPQGKYADGGMIPGPSGAEVPIIAHAGEVVLNEAQQRNVAAGIVGGGGGGEVIEIAVALHLDGRHIDDSLVRLKRINGTLGFEQ